MGYKTVETYVEVEVNLDEFDDSELIDEMKDRGYDCIKSDGGSDFDREDWQTLLKILDKSPETWYTRRIRSKITGALYGVATF